MPEHLRALVVILGISVPAFWLAGMVAPSRLMSLEDFRRRRNLWFTITLLAFFSHSFWLYIIMAAGVLLWQVPRERNPVALYLLLLFAVPGFDQPIPGMGLVNFLFDINHGRLLSLTILLPAALRLSARTPPMPAITRIPDAAILCFIAYVCLRQMAVDTVTNSLRAGFYLMTDVWLLYYVASRSLRDRDRMREAVACLIVALGILSVIAVFETFKHWLLYESLRPALGLPPQPILIYLTRGEGGALRANGSVLNAIALGYTMMIGLALLVYLLPSIRPRWMGRAVVLVLAVGLLASLSRGPWLGTAVMVLGASLAGRGALKRVTIAGLVGGIALGAVLVSPWGGTVVDHLPFVGSVEADNVTYRQRLLDISWIVLMEHPVFGARDFLLHPMMEQLRQGQGIIDIVNTYLEVALANGLIGLGLFLVAPLFGLGRVWWSVRNLSPDDLEGLALGRALFGCLVGVLFTIGTVSSISVIPTLLWFVTAASIAYLGLGPRESVATKVASSVGKGMPWRFRGQLVRTDRAPRGS
ncbi:MAG: hypothetical protein KatS3mg122_0600 [Caldimonas sp.]|uniref:O-antigen ligase family protein n=1 Tax=Caldimonas taiwanensis TaxID=307483 RepID=UPI0007861E93|nr:O-antigen ligase family protein [Caldimonas taiwanensis]GIX23369.1 MAG: hypothetical protein KatS3mg122_0600 [Caldimonas sp.]